MIFEKAHAKINLALDVVRKREDSFHDLKMIMVPLELHDELIFKKAQDIKLTSNIDIKDNAVLKTTHFMKEKYQINQGVHLILNKNIPIGAGLGGGSSDIAATIRGLNRLWNLKLTKKELESIALSLGSDTLFCLYQKPAYVHGRGEFLEFLSKPEASTVFLYYPNIIIKTSQIFKNHQVIHQPGKFEDLLSIYQEESWDLFYNKTYNDLLKTALNCYPELKVAMELIKSIDDSAYMTGSGSTFFILNSKQKDEEIIEKSLQKGLILIKTTIKV